MKRGDPPASLADGDGTEPAPRVAWYDKLYKEDGKINDRWNTHEKDRVTGTTPIRSALSSLSDGLCAYCGVRLPSGWHVEHWLPSDKFPRLAYYWPNLLPACAGCNLKKKAIAPPVTPKPLIDPALVAKDDEAPYNKVSFLEARIDRIIDPSHDDPMAHIEFECAAMIFVARAGSAMGALTIKKLRLLQERDVANDVARISEAVRLAISKGLADDAVVALVSLTAAYPTLVEEFCGFWRSFSLRARM
ncbi:MAG: hypothetical protein JNK05_05120 [Myxococcales bacterium]|nr:hypothetical protein [Myxococcales bacterium]